MELNEVAARVLGRHLRLIAACVIAGLLAVWVIHQDDRKQFEATVRMVLDSPDPINQSQASVLADTARGIASGPSLVRAALSEVGATRDPVLFGEKNVDVRPLGSSGVLRLVVTDTDPRVAVEMANATAEAVIAARSRVTDGTASKAALALEREISALDGQLGKLDKRIDALTPLSPEAVIDPHDTARVRAFERSRDALTRRLGQLQGELIAIQGERALRPQAGVIDPATKAEPLPGRLVPDYLLGALLGLIVGVALAAVRETLVPTVVGHAALARALGAPILADLPQPPDRCRRKDVAVAARHVELAAVAAGVRRVEMMSLERVVDVSRLLEFLDDELTSAVVHGMDPVLRPGRRSPGLSDVGGRADGRSVSSSIGDGRTGLVVVVPDVVRLADLEPARNLVSITGWPLLGAIVFPRTPRYLPPRHPRDRKPSEDVAPPRLTQPMVQQGNGASA